MAAKVFRSITRSQMKQFEEELLKDGWTRV
jgi:hypothetical protein